MLKCIPKNSFTYLLRDYFIRAKIFLPFIGYPLNRKEGFRPFYIVGSVRSGNTLLRRILVADPSIHIPPEVIVTKSYFELYNRFRSIPWPTLVRLILAQFEYFQAPKQTDQIHALEIPLRPLVGSLERLPKNRRSLAIIVDSIYRYHAEQKGIHCERWGEKVPLNTFAMEEIQRVFPDVQFVNLIRDGSDVSVSAVEAGIHADIESAGLRWIRSLRAVERFSRRHPGFVLDVRYEDLVSNPEETIKRVCQFLGLAFSSSMLHSERIAKEMGDVPLYKHYENVFKPISTQSIGRGRRSLTITQTLRLDRIIGKDLKRLGYPPLVPH